MAVLASTHPTMQDLSRRLGPDNRIAKILELLDQEDGFLTDVVWIEGNLPTGHRTTIRTGLPTPTWRRLYGGVQPTKSTTAQVTDACGMLEAYAEVDKALADLNGNTAEFRLSEDRPHLEGIRQELIDTWFYGNETTEPEAFTGLTPRFNSLSAANAENIIDANTAANGGDADNNGTVFSSMWLMVMGPNTLHGIYPKGSTVGLQMEDKGQVTIENAGAVKGQVNGGRMEAYRTHYRWDCGLSLRDWRYVVRIANIKTSLLKADLSSGPDLCDLIAQAEELIPEMGMGRTMLCMNRTLRSMLRRQLNSKVKNSTLERATVNGRTVTQLGELTIRRVDRLHNNEPAVV